MTGRIAFCVVLAAGCAAEPATSSTSANLATTADTDIAVECTGILAYVNWASFAELDSYLPATTAQAIVSRRATQPFTSISDISSISGIAQARLAQITGRAFTLDFIDADCAGTFEELAVSHDDAALILSFMNTASADTLHDVVRAEANTVVPALIAARPFTSLTQLVNVSGVGPSTFRAIRDAAVVGPFDALAAQLTALNHQAALRTAFDWFAIAVDQPGRQRRMTCFGVPADLVAEFGGELRPNLADGAEVIEEVTNTINYANRFNELDPTAGLADLSAQVTGQQFFGCYLAFQPDPWSEVDRAFFVNTQTGYRVLSERRWSE